jgi:hypothetical protein
LETGPVDGLAGAAAHVVAWSERGNVTLIDAKFAPRVLTECVGQLPRSPLRSAAVTKRDLLLATDEEVLRFALPSCLLLARLRLPGVESLMAGSGFYAILRRRGEAFLRALEPNLQPLWQRPLGWEKCGGALQLTVALDRLLVACGRSQIIEVPRLFTAAEVEYEEPSWAQELLQYSSYVAGAIGLYMFYKYIRRPPPPTPEEMAEMMEALRTDHDETPEERQQNQREFASSEKPGVKQLFSQLPKNLKDELRGVLEKQQAGMVR